ncbi:hypothetical protein [Pseudomonas protegens]|uniref:hypothetical protein n=1 Tax=Pseudomonas protegens TaxID=380021 RepID=UPI0006424C83|nr:hypothetical protein [Pseudomonas protegens]
MTIVTLEIDPKLYQLLQVAAADHQISLEDECRRRLAAQERPSRYLQALVAELRADDQQRRAARS